MELQKDEHKNLLQEIEQSILIPFLEQRVLKQESTNKIMGQDELMDELQISVSEIMKKEDDIKALIKSSQQILNLFETEQIVLLEDLNQKTLEIYNLQLILNSLSQNIIDLQQSEKRLISDNEELTSQVNGVSEENINIKLQLRELIVQGVQQKENAENEIIEIEQGLQDKLKESYNKIKHQSEIIEQKNQEIYSLQDMNRNLQTRMVENQTQLNRIQLNLQIEKNKENALERQIKQHKEIFKVQSQQIESDKKEFQIFKQGLANDNLIKINPQQPNDGKVNLFDELYGTIKQYENMEFASPYLQLLTSTQINEFQLQSNEEIQSENNKSQQKEQDINQNELNNQENNNLNIQKDQQSNNINILQIEKQQSQDMNTSSRSKSKKRPQRAKKHQGTIVKEKKESVAEINNVQSSPVIPENVEGSNSQEAKNEQNNSFLQKARNEEKEKEEEQQQKRETKISSKIGQKQQESSFSFEEKNEDKLQSYKQENPEDNYQNYEESEWDMQNTHNDNNNLDQDQRLSRKDYISQRKKNSEARLSEYFATYNISHIKASVSNDNLADADFMFGEDKSMVRISNQLQQFPDVSIADYNESLVKNKRKQKLRNSSYVPMENYYRSQSYNHNNHVYFTGNTQKTKQNGLQNLSKVKEFQPNEFHINLSELNTNDPQNNQQDNNNNLIHQECCLNTPVPFTSQFSFQLTDRQQQDNSPHRKDPYQEYFILSCQAAKLNSKYFDQIYNMKMDFIWKEIKEQKIPFQKCMITFKKESQIKEQTLNKEKKLNKSILVNPF